MKIKRNQKTSQITISAMTTAKQIIDKAIIIIRIKWISNKTKYLKNKQINSNQNPNHNLNNKWML